MNLSLFIPEIALAATAILVILVDLFVEQKIIIKIISLAGLAVSGVFAFAMWGENNPALFNGMLAVDNLGIFFKLLFAGISFLVILASTDYVKKMARFQGEYYALILFATTGMMLMAATTDLISIFISLELVNISLYALVGLLKTKPSTESALKYMLLSAISSAVMLYGMTLIFGTTSETQLSGIAQALSGSLSSSTNPALLTGMVLMIAGFSFKVAAVPFQMWVPDVYEGAPTTITAFLSVASKAAGFAVILRVFLTAFPGFNVYNLGHDWGIVFAALAIISMVVGNTAAIWQTNIKRLLGYSSIAQAGYIMVGLAAAGMFTTSATYVPGAMAQSGVLFFLVSYALTNLGAFIAVIAITGKTGTDLIEDFAGMGKRSPLLALALTLCLISLIGIPPAAGFMAKFYIFGQAIKNDLLWLVIIAVINSVISAYYYLRVVKVMWFSEPASPEKILSSAAPKVALVLCCVGVLLLGIIPGLLMKIAGLTNLIPGF